MRHHLQQLARHLLTLATGIDVVQLAEDRDNLYGRLASVKNELAALKRQMQPAAGTVMRWRDRGLS